MPANFVNSYVNTTTKSTKLECTQTRAYARDDGIVCYLFQLNECQISINLCLRCLPCRSAAFHFFRSSNNKRRNAFANFLLVNNHHHTTYARTSNMNAEKKRFANTAQNTFNHFLFAFNIHASQSLQDF